MNRDTAQKASTIIQQIEIDKNKKQKLHALKGEIKQILAGHLEIPEEEVYKAFAQIDVLMIWVDKSIDRHNNRIAEL